MEGSKCLLTIGSCRAEDTEELGGQLCCKVCIALVESRAHLQVKSKSSVNLECGVLQGDLALDML